MSRQRVYFQSYLVCERGAAGTADDLRAVLGRPIAGKQQDVHRIMITATGVIARAPNG